MKGDLFKEIFPYSNIVNIMAVNLMVIILLMLPIFSTTILILIIVFKIKKTRQLDEFLFRLRLTRFAATVTNVVFVPSAAPSFTKLALHGEFAQKTLRHCSPFLCRSLRFESCASFFTVYWFKIIKVHSHEWTLGWLRLTRFERATLTSAG